MEAEDFTQDSHVEQKPWCTCGIYYYSYALHPQPYQPTSLNPPTCPMNCINCGKLYKRFYDQGVRLPSSPLLMKYHPGNAALVFNT